MLGLEKLFGKGPLSPKKIQALVKTITHPFAQPDVRMRDMDRLLQEGTPEALAGVLKRFSVNANGHIADEEEKQWLENALVELGDEALEPLAGFVRRQARITYALRAYERIAGPSAGIGFFIEVLEGYGPEDHRSVDAKLALVWQLSEHLADARVLAALAPFLNDHSDDVRWAVMEQVTKVDAKGLGASVRDTLAAGLGDLILGPEVGPRIARRAAEVLAELEWALPQGAGGASGNPVLEGVLAEDFFIDKKRFVRRRAGGGARGAS